MESSVTIDNQVEYNENSCFFIAKVKIPLFGIMDVGFIEETNDVNSINFITQLKKTNKFLFKKAKIVNVKEVSLEKYLELKNK